MNRRGILAAGLASLTLPLRLVAADKEETTSTFKGKVVPLSDLAAKVGAKLDEDAAPHLLALVTDDGKVYPLLKNSESRLFFSDKTLLNRPMQMSGKFLSGSQILRVLEVQSLKNGKPHEVYYWCTICAIRRGEKLVCECCGGPMELREVLLKP